MVSAQFLFFQRRSAADLPGKRRIGDQAASDHDRRALRKACNKLCVILYSKNISVIYDRVRAVLQDHLKSLQVRSPFIEICLGARMHDQFTERIPVVDLQKFRGVFRGAQTDPGLDGKPQFSF